MNTRVGLLSAGVAPDADLMPRGREPATDMPSGLRVLVVDDNDDAATSLAMLLTLSGHAVEVENSGSAALCQAGRFLPHAVLCDLGMPGMSGHEFAQQLRQAQQAPLFRQRVCRHQSPCLHVHRAQRRRAARGPSAHFLP